MTFTSSAAAPATRSGEHPAVRAYHLATSDTRRVAQVDRIQRRRRSEVYRIRWTGGDSVIAKRCRSHMSVVEQAVYAHALPRARDRVRVPAYFGSVHDPYTDPEDPFMWLFIEDLGPRRYAPQDATERDGLARWLGELHAVLLEAGGASVPELPVRDAGYYRRYLDRAIEEVPRLVAGRRAPVGLAGLAGTVESTLHAVRDGWPAVVAAFDHAPPVLVHGDCLPKNIHVVAPPGAAGIADVVPIDWGNAGWGLPASDLGQSALLLGDPPVGEASYKTYAHALRPAWPGCGGAVVRHLADLGRLLWSVKVIAMSMPGFAYDRLDKVEQHLSTYASVLRASARQWNHTA